MDIRYINSACQLLTVGSTTILIDPWLRDGAYYGSWGMVNELGMAIEHLKPEYIWLSHVHPDHYDPASIRTTSPKAILVGTFNPPIITKAMARDGLVPTILANDTWHDCGEFEIAILPLDEVDSIALFRHESRVIAFIVDSILNDDLCARIFALTNRIDLAYIPYTGAGAWPQCYDIPHEDRGAAATDRRMRFITKAHHDFIDLGRPPVVLYAGEYTLLGRLSHLNAGRGVATRQQAFTLLTAMGTNVLDIDIGGLVGFRHGTATVLERGQAVPRQAFMAAYDYDTVICGGLSELTRAIAESTVHMMTMYERLSDRQLDDWQLVLHISDYGMRFIVSFKDRSLVAAMGGKYLEVTVTANVVVAAAKRIVHWNYLEIGSHVIFKRRPDQYIKQLHRMLGCFHS